MMRSISSLGGPLMLLSIGSVERWTGAFGPGGDDDWDEEETEYGQLLEGEVDVAGVVEVAGESSLILYEGMAPTAFLESERIFVQELAKGSEPDIISAVTRILLSVQWRRVATWDCSGPSLLFDSVMYGPGVEQDDGLLVDIEAGQYEVSCAYRKPDSEARIWVALTRLTPTLPTK